MGDGQPLGGVSQELPLRTSRSMSQDLGEDAYLSFLSALGFSSLEVPTEHGLAWGWELCRSEESGDIDMRTFSNTLDAGMEKHPTSRSWAVCRVGFPLTSGSDAVATLDRVKLPCCHWI